MFDWLAFLFSVIKTQSGFSSQVVLYMSVCTTFYVDFVCLHYILIELDPSLSSYGVPPGGETKYINVTMSSILQKISILILIDYKFIMKITASSSSK